MPQKPLIDNKLLDQLGACRTGQILFKRAFPRGSRGSESDLKKIVAQRGFLYTIYSFPTLKTNDPFLLGTPARAALDYLVVNKAPRSLVKEFEDFHHLQTLKAIYKELSQHIET